MFPGWVGFSQWIKKEFGNYPKREMLVELGKMMKAEREESTLFGAYLWDSEKKKKKVKDVLDGWYVRNRTPKRVSSLSFNIKELKQKVACTIILEDIR